MKKIAVVHDSMLIGGTEVSLIEFLNQIDYQKYDVTLFLKNLDGPLQDRINKNVIVCSWNTDDPSHILRKQIIDRHYLQALKGVWYRLLARIYAMNWDKNMIFATKCLPVCSNEYYDCVIAYNGVSTQSLATCLYRLNGAKKIVWIHGDGVFMDNRQIEKEYQRFDVGCFVSESMAKLFLARYPTVKLDSIVIHNYVDSKYIIDKSVEMVPKLLGTAILTVGRLSVEKGQDLVPQTARMLLDAGYNIHWYIIGEGDLRCKVEEQIQRYEVDKNVILLGAIENPYPYIKCCDLYVQTSLAEGWGLSVQEARILQKPIVVTPLPAMREQIRDGENGFVSDDVTPSALFKKIRMLLDCPEMCDRFRKTLKNEDQSNLDTMQTFYKIIDN